MVTILPPDEGLRLAALARYAVLDTTPEAAFDSISNLAARLLDVPIAQLSFLDLHRRWSKASMGAHPREVKREVSLCSHAILGAGAFIVPDALADARFEGNPLLDGPQGIRFYAAVPLRTSDGFNLGTLSIIDHQPRALNVEERERIERTLNDLARLTMEHLEQRRAMLEASEEVERRRSREELVLDRQMGRAQALGVESECFFTVDRAGRIREWEAGAAEMFGWSAQAAHGRDLVELVVPEEWHRRYKRALEMCFAGAEREQNTASGADLAEASPEARAAGAGRIKMLAHRPGSLSDFYLELGLARLDTGGEVLFRAYVRNIDGRERADDWLRQLEMVVDNANDAILITEAEPQNHPGPRILYCNAAFTRMTGFSEAEILGKTPRMLHGKGTNEEARAKIRAALKKWQPVVVEMLNYRKDGTPFWVELSIVPVADETGWWTHWVSVQRDITARKTVEEDLQRAHAEAETARQSAEIARFEAEDAQLQAETLREAADTLREAAEDTRRQAEDANAAKSEFLSRMSHELRTPLNAILGFAQLMQMEPLDPEQGESVHHILKAGGHLLELINEVLDIARIEAGRLAMSPEPVQVSDVLEEVMALVGPLAAREGVKVGAPPQTGDLFVMADRQRLKQVMLNLLSNAVKYNRRGGSVEVACRVEAERVRLAVSDTGIGIAPAKLGDLFVPFERLGAEKSSVEGTGLGLALSKRLVEAMQGRLEVQSMPGEGSTFSVEVPRAANPLRALDNFRDESADGGVAALPRRKVLYIEDNLSNFTLVHRILSGRSHLELLAAMQGGMGLDLAREHRPDLILLDLHLPDMDGTEVLARLRQDDLTRAIPVVIISADATPGRLERLKREGVAAYLTKPIDVRLFLALIDELLDTPDEFAPQSKALPELAGV